MERKHTITELENNLISILIGTFKNHGWAIDELPSIIDSDEKPMELTENRDNLDIDKYLGIYRTKDTCSKGEVVLYRENIKDLSKRYFIELGMRGLKINGKSIFIFLTTDDYLISENDVFDYLNSIVLIHELTHWMIHWNSDFKEKSLKCDDKYESDDEINFHEGLAQFFTDYVIRNYGNKKMLDLFVSLNSNQSEPYQVFEKLKKDLDGNQIDISCVFTALGICWNNNFKQSFEELEKYNFLTVLYYPNDYNKSFNNIIDKNHAIDQEKIFNWYMNYNYDEFLKQYISEQKKKDKIGKYTGKRYGL